MDLQTVVEQALAANAFQRRRWSWVASFGGHFLKIPGTGPSARADSGAPHVLEEAKRENHAIELLAQASEAVVKPHGLVESHACLVFPFLEGEDLRTILLRVGNSPVARDLIRRALAVARDFHAFSSPIRLTRKAYLDSGEGVPVVDGFEVRNFRVQAGGTLRFFDPHNVTLGHGEEDFTRFVLSLLMLNWGRSWPRMPWTDFNYGDLLRSYGEFHGRAPDAGLLRRTFGLNCAMREERARIAIRGMPFYVRPFASLYKTVFFHHTDRWRARNGL